MILKHRDRELLRFEWGEPQGVRVVSINESERKFLPLDMKGEATDETLWTWLVRRTVPRNRRHIEELMARMGLDPRLRERVEDAFLEAVTSQVRGRHPERGGAPEARRAHPAVSARRSSSSSTAGEAAATTLLFSPVQGRGRPRIVAHTPPASSTSSAPAA